MGHLSPDRQNGSVGSYETNHHQFRREKVREFKNKVAVITDAASGIGRGQADRGASFTAHANRCQDQGFGPMPGVD
jgi:hypothetical protein